MTSPRLRVLMVSDVFLPRINGVSTSIDSFRQGLPAHGVDVKLVAPRYGDEPDQEGIERVASRPAPGDAEDRLPRWRRLHEVVLQEAADCDLVHIQTPFSCHYAGLSAARKLGIPAIATYHTLFEEYAEHYVRFLPAQLARSIARGMSRRQCDELDAVVVPSEAMRQRLLAYGVESPMTVLPTGIPLGLFETGDRQTFRARHGIAPDRPVALFVGRVAHEKNMEFLLEAMAGVRASVPDALLVVIGDGPARASLETRATEMGLADAVSWLGYQDHDRDLPHAYAAADVFAFASKTETQGLVLLEAMAAGLPVVALAAMGTIEILAPLEGCLAPVDDVGDFAQALAKVLSDAPFQQELSSRARLAARSWSDDAAAGRLAELYHATILGHDHR